MGLIQRLSSRSFKTLKRILIFMLIQTHVYMHILIRMKHQDVQ